MLVALTHGVESIFGENLVGIYLMGSLTYGDFNPGRSDIDLVVVLMKAASGKDIEQLKELHARVEKIFPVCKKRIESQYVPIDFFRKTLPPKEPRPYYGEGTFYAEAPYGNEWLINVAMLYEYGMTIYGRDFREIVSELDYDVVRRASARDLLAEWVPKIDDPEYLNHPHYQAYAVLNVCRILYTVLNGALASKSTSAKWVNARFPEWRELVEAALAWEYGKGMSYRKETEKFIWFAVEQIKDKT